MQLVLVLQQLQMITLLLLKIFLWSLPTALSVEADYRTHFYAIARAVADVDAATVVAMLSGYGCIYKVSPSASSSDGVVFSFATTAHGYPLGGLLLHTNGESQLQEQQHWACLCYFCRSHQQDKMHTILLLLLLLLDLPSTQSSRMLTASLLALLLPLLLFGCCCFSVLQVCCMAAPTAL